MTGTFLVNNQIELASPVAGKGTKHTVPQGKGVAEVAQEGILLGKDYATEAP